MTTWMKRTGVVALVAVIAFSVIGTAAAQGPGRSGPRQDAPRDRVLRAVLGAFKDATGLTLEDVAPELREGQTLGEIIAENGLDVDDVTAQVQADLTADIEQALGEGRITQEAADRLLEGLDDALARVLTTPVPQPRDGLRDRVADGADNAMIAIMAEMAGMEPGELLRDVLAPPTLAEVAAELGLDPDAIIDEAVARITEDVNQAAADGKLSEEQAAQVLDGLRDRLEDRMDSPLRLRQNFRKNMRPGGRGPGGNNQPPQDANIT